MKIISFDILFRDNKLNQRALMLLPSDTCKSSAIQTSVKREFKETHFFGMPSIIEIPILEPNP